MSPTFTLQTLHTRTLSELHALRRTVLREIDASRPGSAEAREAWANLAAIDQMIRRRLPAPRF